jgi:hypothetical protein
MKEKKEGKAAFLGGTGEQGNTIALYIFWPVSLYLFSEAGFTDKVCFLVVLEASAQTPL